MTIFGKHRLTFSLAYILVFFTYAPLAGGDQSLRLTRPEGGGSAACQLNFEFPPPKRVSKPPILDIFKKFKYNLLPNGGGFNFFTGKPNARTRVVNLSVTFHPLDVWTRKIWQSESQWFQFIDVGFRNLETDSAVTNGIIAAHLTQYPDDNLTVRYGEERIHAEEILSRYRWELHDAVIDKYATVKPYLTPMDLFDLKALNLINDNNDVLGLLDYFQGTDLSTLTAEQIKEHLIMTIQITYFGERNFFTPSPRGILMASGERIDETEDKMPFEHRITPGALPNFRRMFYSDFNRRTICELTRYAKFVNKIPQAIQDKFLLEAIRTAMNRGMKTMIVSADQATARLYRRYGFKVYSELPTGSGELEYLMYMHSNGPEFVSLLSRLDANASQVDVMADDFQSKPLTRSQRVCRKEGSSGHLVCTGKPRKRPVAALPVR